MLFLIVKFRNFLAIRFYKYFYLFIFYTSLSFIIYNTSPFSIFFFSQYLKIIFWILPLFFFHVVFSQMYEVRLENYLKFFVITYIVQSLALILKGYSSLTGSDETIYALGAGIPFILPLLFSVFRKRALLWLYLLTLAIAIISLKRTPVLLTLIAPIFFYRSLLKSLRLFEIAVFIAIISFSGVIGYLLNFIVGILERNSAELTSQSFGSGRSIFYAIILNQWWNNNFLSQLFGNGLSSVNNLLYKQFGIPISAHNGYLQALYDYGLIGFSLYSLIFIHLIKNRRIIKRHTRYYKQYLMFITIWLVQNLITHGYSGTNFIAFSLFIAFVFSQVSRNKQNLYDQNQTRSKTLSE